jgi:hypothetical protein
MAMNDTGEPAAGFAQRVDAMTLARAQAGDMQAFAALYSMFGRPCFNLACESSATGHKRRIWCRRYS